MLPFASVICVGAPCAMFLALYDSGKRICEASASFVSQPSPFHEVTAPWNFEEVSLCWYTASA